MGERQRKNAARLGARARRERQGHSRKSTWDWLTARAILHKLQLMRVSVALVGGILIGGLVACSIPLYKVAPLPQNTPIVAGSTATANSLEVTASALTEDDISFERFGTNLPLAGIVVVDIRLANRANERTNPLTFELQDANGKRLASLDAKKELKRVMQFEGVRVYAKEGKQQTLDQLQAIALPKKLTLAPQEERRGVVFFQAKQDVAPLKGLVLLVKGTAQPLRLPLP